MSASPSNASIELTKESTALALDQASRSVPTSIDTSGHSSSHAPGHEALQALLAFSALQQQIEQRRAQEKRNGASLGPADAWELEQFVLGEVLQLVAERALAITGADGVGIALAEGNEIICRASVGTIVPDPGARLDPNSGFSGACFRTGKVVRCDDSENDPRVNVQACRRLGTRSMMAVPLAGQHNVLGLLEAFSTEAYAFNDSDVRSLKLLAELILAAMRPEEEDRLAEISRQVSARGTVPIVAEHPVQTFPLEESVPPATIVRAEAEQNLATPAPEKTFEFSPAAARDHKEKSRPGLVVVLVLVLLAAAIGGGLWWKIHGASSAAGNSLHSTAQAIPVQAASLPEPAPPSATGAGDAVASQSAPSSPMQNPVAPTPTAADTQNSAGDDKLAGLPLVTGIRHWSSADSSTVVLDLQQQVQYEAHRLSGPDRIYFDLHNTALAAGLFGKTLEVQDALLVRVRLAQPTPGVTRVVLETKVGSSFSVSLESNPYRLVVEVRGSGAALQPQTKSEVVKPVPSAKNSAPAASLNGDSLHARAHIPQLRIVLDAGHGGWDLGTVGRKGLLEKDLVLDIVDRVGALLEKRLGAEVIYTRQDDNYVALEKRAEIANLAQASLFMSIHANYSDDPSARGVETYYSNTYSSVKARTRETDAAGTLPQTVNWTNVDIREKVQESRKVAASIQHALYGMLAAKNPGIRNRGVKEASYVVLTGTSMPAILAEVSFVSSPTDEKNLQSEAYRQQIAEALYKGLAKYAEASRQQKIASTTKPAVQQNGKARTSAALLVR